MSSLLATAALLGVGLGPRPLLWIVRLRNAFPPLPTRIPLQSLSTKRVKRITGEAFTRRLLYAEGTRLLGPPRASQQLRHPWDSARLLLAASSEPLSL